MKNRYSLLIILVLIGLLGSVSAYDTFEEYVVRFQKVYTDAEYSFRRGIYQARVEGFAKITDYVPGVNNLTDWTQEEINSLSQLQQLPQ